MENPVTHLWWIEIEEKIAQLSPRNQRMAVALINAIIQTLLEEYANEKHES